MPGGVEARIHQFIAVSYTRIEGLVQAHIAADPGGKRVIEAHIAETFEEIVAAEILAELLDIGW